MTRLPTTPGANAGRLSRIPGQVDAKRVSYVEAERVGFEKLPDEILSVLLARGLLVGTELAATASTPVVKRRRDDSYYRLVEAWWASTRCFVEISARRELVASGNAKFRPSGRWSAIPKVFMLPSGLEATSSIWKMSKASSEERRRNSIHTDDPLEMLPPEIAEPVKGGSTDAWILGMRGQTTEATETVVGSLVTSRRVRVLRATRVARSTHDLVTADWRIETLDSPIVESLDVHLESSVLWTPTGDRRSLPR